MFSLGIKPVYIIKIGAVFEGLLLTPFQAVALMIGLLWVLPRLLSKEAWNILKPNWILILGLAVAAVVFGYFCMFMLQA